MRENNEIKNKGGRIDPDMIPPWNPLYVRYDAGALLTYAGSVYRSLYDHLSTPGRDPFTARDLYEEVIVEG